jgi:ribosome-associated toxin RatA of RatAB toxin-antitoxin module
MAELSITFSVPADADHAYALLRQFPLYAALSDVIASVEVLTERDLGDGTSWARSAWRVTFRQGPLSWEEEDHFDPAARTITFSSAHGDFDSFSGRWEVLPRAEGSLVHLDCAFDFGIATLSGMLDPLAAKVLTETMSDVVRGLVPGSELVLP